LADDDCIINKNWAQYAVKTLDNRTISLVYGQTKPYQPNKHKGQFCPSTFKKNPNIFSVATKLDRHWVNVGFDNNVAMKRRIIDNIGGYKKWLGPNSIIPAAEDAEFILRAQIAGYKIAYNPKMIVYHNKWMSKHDHENLIEDYTLGGITAYAFYAFQGVTECRRIMLEHVKFYFYKIKADVKKIIINPVHVGPNLKNIIHMIHDLTKGILTAFVFSKIIPIPEKENVVKRFYKTT
jgi:GT2 family glycosyltransferase